MCFYFKAVPQWKCGCLALCVLVFLLVSISWYLQKHQKTTASGRRVSRQTLNYRINGTFRVSIRFVLWNRIRKTLESHSFSAAKQIKYLNLWVCLNCTTMCFSMFALRCKNSHHIFVSLPEPRENNFSAEISSNNPSELQTESNEN